MPVKQTEIAGQIVRLYSVDGRLWCSRPIDVLAAKRKKEQIDKELKTMNGNIYLRRVNDNYGCDPEDYYLVRLR